MTTKSILTAEEEAQLKATYPTELERTLVRKFLTEYHERSEAVIKNHKEQLALIDEYKSYLAEIQQKGVENLTYFEERYILKKVEAVERELTKKEAEGRLLKIELEELTDRLEVA